jgi:hypothetical protein
MNKEKNMKRFFIYLIAAIVIGGIIGGIFIGGIALGKSQGREEMTQEMQDQTIQFTSRFGQDGLTNLPADMTPLTGTGIPFGRGGTMGIIEKIEGNTITVKTMSGSSINVVTSSETTFKKMGSGSLSDIKTGDSISVSGTSQDDGSIQATSILITPNSEVSK